MIREREVIKENQHRRNNEVILGNRRQILNISVWPVKLVNNNCKMGHVEK